jgi:hypothetical protein
MIARRTLYLNGLYLLCIYIFVETLAKASHELGHAAYALSTGTVGLGDISIHVNPFSGAFTNVSGFRIKTNLARMLFSLSGTIPPIALGLAAFLASALRRTPRPALALFSSYALIANGVNLGAGLIISGSDTMGLMRAGIPWFAIASLAACLMAFGAYVMVRKVFDTVLPGHFARGIRFAFLAFAIPTAISLITAFALGDSPKKRILFSAIELGLLSLLFAASRARSRKRRETPVEPAPLASTKQWVFATIGVVCSLAFYLEYICSYSSWS